jgi:hypothetical protein
MACVAGRDVCGDSLVLIRDEGKGVGGGARAVVEGASPGECWVKEERVLGVVLVRA